MVDYVFKPYDPIFPRLFQEEKERLQQFLLGDYKLEHFGSTAVIGLGGKGIIDLYIIAPQGQLPDVFTAVEQAGYESRPAASKPERFVYVHESHNNGKKQRYHLHITFPESSESKKDFAFRDYLRTHADAMRDYAVIKQKAAQEAHSQKDVYMKIKEPVIQEILKKALSI